MRRRPRPFRFAMAGACLAALTAPGPAQTLDLDARPEPPSLKNTFAAHLIGQLQSEITALRAPEARADSADVAVAQALVSYRVIAADLLAIGDRDQKAGSVAVVSGFRLARGRDDLERILRKLPALDRDGEDTRRFERALFAVRLFSEKATEQTDALRRATGDERSARLARVLSPLADAIATLEDPPLPDHWVSRATVVGSSRAPGGSSLVGLETLRQRLADAPLDDETRAEMASIVGFLERGNAFSEWQPLVREYRRLLERVVDLSVVLGDADWLPADARDEYAARIRDAVFRFRDPRTRSSGLARLAALDRSRLVLERMTLLAREWRVKLRDLEAARAVLDATPDDGLPPRLDDLDTLADILSRMIELRRLRDDEVELGRDLRVAHRDLIEASERSESALVSALGALAARFSEGLTDPAFSSLVNDQRQYLTDLRRVREIPRWMQAVTAVDPDSAELFAADLRRLSRSLLDTNRRPDAILALSRLEDRLERYFPMPFEAELRAGTGAAIVATGAQHERLMMQIETARRGWIEGWTDGNAVSAEHAVELLYRLTLVMADTAPIVAREGDASLLNRWAMWELPGGAIARPMSDLPARLKLATASAVDGDVAGLERQLDRLERDAPVTRLAGRLLGALEPSLERLPDGARSSIGQSVHPPTGEAWLASSREDLAHLCRYTMELEYARLTGRPELADGLRAYVNALATEILNEVEAGAGG